MHFLVDLYNLMNTTQVINYVHIAEANPKTQFALWTKNPQLIVDAKVKIPENLNIIISSLFLNKAWDSLRIKRYEDVLGTPIKNFTVYDKSYIKSNNVNINCGAKSCMSCQLCYTKNNEKHINEKLK